VVIKSMELFDMSASQSKQIINRFLLDSRQHLFAPVTDRPKKQAVCASAASPHSGKSDD